MVLSFCVGATCCGRAEIVDFDFSGFISNISISTRVTNEPHDAYLSIGAPFTGTLRYETLTGSQGGGLYRPDMYPIKVGLIGFDIKVNGYSYTAGEVDPWTVRYAWMQVTDRLADDSFSAFVETHSGEFVALTLSDSTGTVFTSDALPTKLNIADWDSATLQVDARWGTHFSGIIAPVPEPSTLALTILSAAVVFGRRR